jgi:cytochrome c-type biogenesis protein CcmF
VVPRTQNNYREDMAELTVLRDGVAIGSVETSKRLYLTRGTPTTEAGILTLGVSQVYASIGEVMPGGAIGLRLYHKPLVLLIWLGGVVMAAGGALSFTDRRFKVGAPQRARAGAEAPMPAGAAP